MILDNKAICIESAKKCLLDAQQKVNDARNNLHAAQSETRAFQAILKQLGACEVGRKNLTSRSKSYALVNVCIEVIEREQRRVTISEFLTEIMARGLEIGGKDEKSNLAGYLSRDPRVNYVKPDGWALCA